MAKRHTSLLGFVKKTDSSTTDDDLTQMEVATIERERNEGDESVSTLQSPVVSVTGETSIRSAENDSADVCAADCCNPSRDKPYQPDTKEILDRTKQIQGQGKNEQARYVQASWFKQHSWLTLCTSRQKLFCFYCSAASRSNLLVFSKNADTAFVSSAFFNWRKASEAFHKHEASQAHSEAMLKLSNKQDVGSQLDHAHKMEQKARRESLLKQLSSLRYLLRQGMAIRGHEASESNIIQLLQLCSDDDPQLKKWLSDQKYFSPDILNEQIEIMGP